MLPNYTKVKPKIFEFKSKFTKGTYELCYTWHAHQPRINRAEDGSIIKESRIISAFTLDRIDKLINEHIIKMCCNPGKWKFFVDSAFGTIMFIVLTKKKQRPDGVYFTADFHSSYTLLSDKKVLKNKKSEDTIYLKDFLICEENRTIEPTEAELNTYIEKETKEITAREKKKARDDKKWSKKKKRKDERYAGGFQKLPHYKGRSKVYLPTNTNAERKAIKAKKTADKLKYDNYYDY